MNLTYGSLFAGVGGFDMGFDRAGYHCRFQVEWDAHCQQILARHWPDVPRWGDITGVNGAELPPVDTIIFGSPCQDLSRAGKRAGIFGERSGTFFEAMRVIKEMRDATDNTFPRTVIWENVVGSFGSNGGADFGEVLDQMAEAGALVIEWAVLDAQHFGVPQRRRRVFVVAVLDPAAAGRCPDPLLPVSDSLRGDHAPGYTAQQGTTTTTNTGIPADYQSLNEPALCFDTQFGSNANVFAEQSPTLKSSQQPPSVLQDGKVRRLTPVECERLMGWPEDHTRWGADGTELSATQRVQQCGNGVATPVAQWIAGHLRPLLTTTTTTTTTTDA
jgi:DNA (cytosine-5)-methyltransferase 1